MSRVPAVFILKRQACYFALELYKTQTGLDRSFGAKLSQPAQASECLSLAFIEVTQLLQLNLEFYSHQTLQFYVWHHRPSEALTQVQFYNEVWCPWIQLHGGCTGEPATRRNPTLQPLPSPLTTEAPEVKSRGELCCFLPRIKDLPLSIVLF